MRASILTKNPNLSQVVTAWFERLGFDEVAERPLYPQREGDCVLTDETDPKNSIVAGTGAQEGTQKSTLNLKLSAAMRPWISSSDGPFTVHRPLHESQFESHVIGAYIAHHAQQRTKVLWIGETAPPLQKQLQKPSSQNWEIVFSKPQLAAQNLSSVISSTAVIVVDPSCPEAEKLHQEFRTWRRSPENQALFWVCLSRSPSLSGTFRTLFQRYVENETRSSPDLNSQLQTWIERARQSFPIRLWSAQLRELLNRNLLRDALELSKKLTPLATESWELQGLTASIQAAAGDPSSAWKTLESALALNPFAPGLYSQALTLLDAKDPRLSKALSQAILFCPGLKSDLTSLSPSAGSPT